MTYTTISATASLEARSLRATIRLECSPEDHPIWFELFGIPDAPFVEIELSQALALVAPQMLHQLIESVSEYLRLRHRQEFSSKDSSNGLTRHSCTITVGD